MLAPFRARSFRFQWPADLVTSCAFEMETLILGWYVLVETGSVLLLTLFGALLFVGTLVAPMFGVAGDRVGHRNLLAGMRAFYALQAASLMLIAFAGALSPAVVLVIAGLMGIVRPSDLGVRAALVADTMASDELVAAMGISRTTSDSARIAGALTGAGMFAAFGIGAAYVAVVAFYVLGLLLTLGISSRRHGSSTADTADVAPTRPSAWRDLAEGLAHVWSTPRLLAATLLAVLVNLTAFPLSGGLLPYVARDVYHIGQTGLGYLVASFAFGALLGSLAVSMRSSIRPARMMILSAMAWYGSLLIFAQLRHAAGGAAMLLLAGFAQSFSMVTLAVLMLRTTDARFRGRVMGVRMMAIYSLPLGLIGAGVLIERTGFHTTATLYALTGLALTLAIGLVWRDDIWHADVPANAR